jgi:hypothetical protein
MLYLLQAITYKGATAVAIVAGIAHLTIAMCLIRLQKK